MSLFVSYSSRDEAATKDVITDLESARHEVWYDQDLTGGQSWWDEILLQIRRASVFVLIVSAHSLRSRPCRAELDYARQLGLPVLPVQVGDLPNLRTTPVAGLQIIDYRQSTRSVGVALLSAVAGLGERRGSPPRPLPAAPPAPYEYLMMLGRSIDGPSLSASDQIAIVAQLREGLRTEDDDSARNDFRNLLDRLRARPDVTFAAVREIDAVLVEAPAGARSAGGGSASRARPSSPDRTARRPDLMPRRSSIAMGLGSALVLAVYLVQLCTDDRLPFGPGFTLLANGVVAGAWFGLLVVRRRGQPPGWVVGGAVIGAIALGLLTAGLLLGLDASLTMWNSAAHAVPFGLLGWLPAVLVTVVGLARRWSRAAVAPVRS